MLWSIEVHSYLVFAMCCASEHNVVSKSSWLGGSEYVFDNEDDFRDFRDEYNAYVTQQQFLETLSDEGLNELGLVIE